MEATSTARASGASTDGMARRFLCESLVKSTSEIWSRFGLWEQWQNVSTSNFFQDDALVDFTSGNLWVAEVKIDDCASGNTSAFRVLLVTRTKCGPTSESH